MSHKHGNGKDKEPRGFEFPGEFEITAMGDANAGLKARVPEILQTIGLKVLHETVSHRHSSEGNYVAVRVSFRCETREQYEAAHTALRADENIRYTL